MVKKILALFILSICIFGCNTTKIGKNYVIANPNNVYRFSENTVLNVLIQDETTGEWINSSKKVLIPVGYYIGSGLEE